MGAISAGQSSDMPSAIGRKGWMQERSIGSSAHVWMDEESDRLIGWLELPESKSAIFMSPEGQGARLLDRLADALEETSPVDAAAKFAIFIGPEPSAMTHLTKALMSGDLKLGGPILVDFDVADVLLADLSESTG